MSKSVKISEVSPLPTLQVVAPPWKGEEDEFRVEFEVLPSASFTDTCYEDERRQINKGLADIEDRLESNAARIAKLNSEIKRLTNNADGIDYATAVICGLIAGVVDSIYVGAWDFKSAKAKANEDVNRQVQLYAEKLGFVYNPTKKGGQLEQAIKYLEKKFPLPGDSEWNFAGSTVSAVTHHLDDYCHHPTLVGLLCCLIVQFTGKATYHDKNGVRITKDVEVNQYGEFSSENVVGKIFCGVVNWFIGCAKVIANAKGHRMSDIAGSAKAKTGGAGIPGSFMATLKELSQFFGGDDGKGNSTNAFADSIRRAYQNGIGTRKSQVDLGVFNCLFDGASSKFDFRTEAAVKGLLKKQMLPVLVNEGLVRGVYFVRHLIKEVRAKGTFAQVDWWHDVLPFNNRTIARMMTIATGTFTACDLADATIRSGIGNGFNVYNSKFWSDIVLRVNFVGVGRFAVAVATDVGMGVQLQNRHWDKIFAQNEQIHLLNAKIQYKLADNWIQVENTGRALRAFEDACSKTWIYWRQCYKDQRESLLRASNYIVNIDKRLQAEFLEELEEP